MTAQEAAHLLGVSRSTLQRLIRDQQLIPVEAPNPLLKRPRRVHFRRADVEALLHTSAPHIAAPPQAHWMNEDAAPYSAE